MSCKQELLYCIFCAELPNGKYMLIKRVLVFRVLNIRHCVPLLVIILLSDLDVWG